MTNASDYLEDALVNHVLRNTALTSPTTVYIVPITTTPDETASGGTVASGASRTAITFAAPSGGASSSSGDVNCGTNSSGSPVSVTGWEIWDAAAAGNKLFSGAISQSVADGTDYIFSSGNVTITCT